MNLTRNRNPIDGDVGFSKPGPHSFPCETDPVLTEIGAQAPLSYNSAGLDSKLTRSREMNSSIITSGSRAYAKFTFWDSFFDLDSEEMKAQQIKQRKNNYHFPEVI